MFFYIDCLFGRGSIAVVLLFLQYVLFYLVFYNKIIPKSILRAVFSLKYLDFCAFDFSFDLFGGNFSGSCD